MARAGRLFTLSLPSLVAVVTYSCLALWRLSSTNPQMTLAVSTSPTSITSTRLRVTPGAGGGLAGGLVKSCATAKRPWYIHPAWLSVDQRRELKEV